MNRDLDYVMFTKEQLKARVQEIGAQLTEEYAGKSPILLCIMKGSLVFTADLMREINLPCTLEYLTLSSYRAMATQPGALDMKEPFELDINGRDIIVIEDILDTARANFDGTIEGHVTYFHGLCRNCKNGNVAAE